MEVVALIAMCATLGPRAMAQMLCAPHAPAGHGSDAQFEPFTGPLQQYGPFPLNTPSRNLRRLIYCYPHLYSPQDMVVLATAAAPAGIWLSDAAGDPGGLYTQALFTSLDRGYKLVPAYRLCPGVEAISANPVLVVSAKISYEGMMGPLGVELYVIMDKALHDACRVAAPVPLKVCALGNDASPVITIPDLWFSRSTGCFTYRGRLEPGSPSPQAHPTQLTGGLLVTRTLPNRSVQNGTSPAHRTTTETPQSLPKMPTQRVEPAWQQSYDDGIRPPAEDYYDEPLVLPVIIPSRHTPSNTAPPVPCVRHCIALFCMTVGRALCRACLL
ncbi:ORF47 [Ranid herpesvirus 1]|uniref:ORF47 n=1 Tax=Ranid herpesvirus 1 TaxID=85655 RepID=Q14VR1_9VIRU|nr:ORF47 [Ranid herpesvirus 1]ABG25754.1 ORF47 [Ranid herpesvirus 1]